MAPTPRSKRQHHALAHQQPSIVHRTTIDRGATRRADRVLDSSSVHDWIDRSCGTIVAIVLEKRDAIEVEIRTSLSLSPVFEKGNNPPQMLLF